MVVSRWRWMVATVAMIGALAGCASEGGGPTAAPSSSMTSNQSSTATAPAPIVTTTAPAPSTVETPVIESPQATENTYIEPAYIVSCQMGLGPVETYWSDGSVTGWSEYCQSVSEQNVAAEAAANTPICELATCRYPSGLEVPNPDYRVVPTPSEWVQGQIDWQNCLEAGNTEDYCRVSTR